MPKRAKLRELIDQAGVKPYILGTKMGYSQGVVYGWLSGRREPCARDMLRLAELLHVNVEVIVRIFGTEGRDGSPQEL